MASATRCCICSTLRLTRVFEARFSGSRISAAGLVLIVRVLCGDDRTRTGDPLLAKNDPEVEPPAPE